MTLTLLLVARRDLEREAFAAILAEADFEVVVYDPADSPAGADTRIPFCQIAVIDARIADPLGEAEALRRLTPAVKIALMVESATTQLVRKAFAAGVAGVIDRGVSCATLVCQLELLALGGCVVPSRFIETITKPETPALAGLNAAAMNRLSVREREIVQCIAAGMANKVIARELRLSEPTVKVHVGAILRKLNLANRTKVAVWAACLAPPFPRPTPLVVGLAVVN